jgi:hypothetical protein
MFNKSVGVTMFALSVASVLAGCSSGRDVEVSGEVKAASTLKISGDIALQFIDIENDKQEVVHKRTLSELGTFKESVTLTGDKVLVRAIADADGDGKCSAGEAWAEVEAGVVKGENDEEIVAGVPLTLSNAPCPASK